MYVRFCKIKLVWWHMPVVSATWEGEVGGLLKTRSYRQAWAIVSPCLKTKKESRELFLHHLCVPAGSMLFLQDVRFPSLAVVLD